MAGTALPVPPEVASRWARCAAGPAVPAPGGDGFRPVYRDDKGTLREVPLQAVDAACLHASLRAVVEYAWRSYSALRTVPANPWVVDDPGRTSWDASDRAATLRLRGYPAYAFLATPPDGSPWRGQRASFLRRRFFPLLDATTAATWLGGLVRPVNAEPPWRAPPTASGQASFVSTFTPLVVPFFERLSGWWAPPAESPVGSAWRRSFALAYGVLVLSAVPLRAIYEAFHGTAAVEVVEPALDAASQTAHAALAGSWVDLLRDVDPELPAAYRALMAGALQHRARLACDLYAVALTEPPRTHFPSAAPTTAALPVASGKWRGLSFTRCVEAATVVDSKRVDPEIYWAQEIAWERLQQACDYVNQAGFALLVNVANNRWGGRHPPHTTHQNGFDFDLDVAIPAVPGDVSVIVGGTDGKGFRRIANLAKLTKIPSRKGGLVDETGERFDLMPVRSGRSSAPTTQTLLDRLALWVALQALQLVGMDDVLYGDFDNMQAAGRHLLGSLGERSPSRPVVTARGRLPRRDEPRQLLEPEGHFDHLHAECPRALDAVLTKPPAFTGQSHWAALNGILLERATERDRDPRFLELMFGREVQNLSTPEGIYRTWWLGRYAGEGPALLPVWDPSVI